MREQAQFSAQFQKPIDIYALTGCKAVGIKRFDMYIGKAAAQGKQFPKLLFAKSVKTVAAIGVNAFVVFENESVDDLFFWKFKLYRLMKCVDTRFECVIA